MMSSRANRPAATAAMLLIASCGLKGPLYLPDEPQAIERAPATSTPRKRTTPTTPAPQSQKEDAAEREEAPQTPAADPDRPASPAADPPPER
jgi:predicted small lipoprotein YifL